MKPVINYYIPFTKLKSALLKKIAKVLHLSIRELKMIEPELYPDMAKDNTVLFYSLYFKHNAPSHILSKIPDIDFDNSVVLSLADVNDTGQKREGLFSNIFFNLKI